MSKIDAENDEEKQAFLPTSSQREEQVVVNQRRHNAWSYLRFALEVLMACSIALLVLRPVVQNPTQPIRSSPVPSFPRRRYKFLENSTYLNGAMFASEKDTLHTLHNWIPLSSDARGYVSVPDYNAFDLGEPLSVRLNRTDEGPGYMVSVFHQLHCLSYIVQHFQTGFGGVNLTEEVAHHSAHCFDYLRQSIMCSADTSLEGKTDAGPGWGSDHECVDYDALLAWANENSAMKWRNLMPEESVL